jgi:adenylate kinase
MLAASNTKLDQVVQFKIDDEVLVDRVVGRWVHPASGRSYHVKNMPPKVAGKDDITGEPLIQRKDDTADTLRSRLGSFHSATTPVIDFYRGKGLLSAINADQPFDKVWAQIATAMTKEGGK